MNAVFSDAAFRDAMRGVKRYVLGPRIGSGGVGVVYEAVDLQTGEEIAIKTLARIGPESLRRFKDEFRSLTDLVHPNLVALYELDVAAGHWFFTMERVRGSHFLEHVRPEGKRHEPALREAMKQLFAGVSALHAQGKIHRDLKPSNVMIESGSRVVVLDFGLVAELDAATGTTDAEKLSGTAIYMAPECISRAPLTPAADFYSIGVMLYEALAGHPPYVGPTSEVLREKQRREPRRLREVVLDLPPDLDELCYRLLRTQPAMRPSAEEVAIAMGWSTLPGSLVRPARAVLVGRQSEARDLAAALDETREGKLITVCVYGQSGIGKSALVDHVATRFVRRLGALVFRGRCYERETMPYKALDAVVDGIARHMDELPEAELATLLPRDAWLLARVFPAMPGSSPPDGASSEILEPRELRRRTAQALASLLAHLAAQTPLVIAIDDVQWGDADSAALLVELFRSAPTLPLLLILCCRSPDFETSPFLRQFLRSDSPSGGRDIRRVELGALPDEEARWLVTAIAGDIGKVSASAIARHALGNPFLVHELSRSVSQMATDERGGDPFEAVLDARMAKLSEEARRLLEIVVVAGHPLEELTAAVAAGVAGQRWRALLGLRAERLVLSRGAEPGVLLEAYHDRIREAVLGRIPPETRRRHHLTLAETLRSEVRVDPERVVEHYVGAGRPGLAVPFAMLAAERAAQALAFSRAASLFELVLDHGAGIDRADILARLGRALSNGGRGGEAARRFEEAAREARQAKPESRAAADLLRLSAEQYLRSGFVDQGLSTMRDVLSSVGAKIPGTPAQAVLGILAHRAAMRLRGFEPPPSVSVTPQQRARLDAYWSAGLGLSMVDTIRSGLFQVRHQRLALATGDPLHVARAFASQIAFVASEGGSRNRARTKELLPRAESLAEAVGEPSLRALVALCGGVAAYFEHDFRRAWSSCRRAERICREQCVGVAWEITNTQIYGLWSLAQLGEMAELASLVPRMVAEARDRGDVFAATSLRLGLPNLIHLASDRPETALAEVEDAMRRWSATGFHSQHYFEILARTHVDLYRRDGAAAHARMEQAWPSLKRALLLRLQALRVELCHLRARAALAGAVDAPAARRAPLIALAERLSRRIEAEDFPSAPALAEALRAGVAVARGRDEEAFAALRTAVLGFERQGMMLLAATSRRAMGELSHDPGTCVAADAWMLSQGIASPERMTRLMLPSRSR